MLIMRKTLNKMIPSLFDSRLANVATLASRSSDQLIWPNFSRDQKTQYALTENRPPNSTIAYYQGLGFSQLRRWEDAAAAFRQAMELNDPVKYARKSESRLNDLKRNLPPRP